jgi:hypothetical protein
MTRISSYGRHLAQRPSIGAETGRRAVFGAASAALAQGGVRPA